MPKRPGTAREFVTASSQYCSVAVAPISAYPLTMLCWVYIGDPAAIVTPMSIGVAGQNNHRHTLLVNSNETISYVARDTAQTAVTTTAAAPQFAWSCLCAVGLSATDRWIYLNGLNGVQNTTSRTPAGMDSYYIGAFHGTTPQNYFSGRIAHPTVWNVALTPSEIYRLAQGVHPLQVRRGSVAAYHALGLASPEPGLYAFHDLTLNNAPTIAVGPPVEPFTQAKELYVDVPAAGGPTVPVLYRQRQMQGMAA